MILLKGLEILKELKGKKAKKADFGLLILENSRP